MRGAANLACRHASGVIRSRACLLHCSHLHSHALCLVCCPLPLQAGPEPACLLRWSPCGSYLLAAQPGGGFRIWETQVGGAGWGFSGDGWAGAAGQYGGC